MPSQRAGNFAAFPRPARKMMLAWVAQALRPGDPSPPRGRDRERGARNERARG